MQHCSSVSLRIVCILHIDLSVQKAIQSSLTCMYVKRNHIYSNEPHAWQAMEVDITLQLHIHVVLDWALTIVVFKRSAISVHTHVNCWPVQHLTHSQPYNLKQKWYCEFDDHPLCGGEYGCVSQQNSTYSSLHQCLQNCVVLTNTTLYTVMYKPVADR